MTKPLASAILRAVELGGRATPPQLGATEIAEVLLLSPHVKGSVESEVWDELWNSRNELDIGRKSGLVGAGGGIPFTDSVLDRIGDADRMRQMSGKDETSCGLLLLALFDEYMHDRRGWDRTRRAMMDLSDVDATVGRSVSAHSIVLNDES